jgi:cyclophilin family peptidyl-prolyl cis-trans isomerase
MITAILLSVAPSLALAPEVQWKAPALFVDGQPYKVHVVVKSTEPVPAWMFDASAFTIDGQPLQERKKIEPITLDKGMREFDYDLGGLVSAHKASKNPTIELGYGEGNKPVTVRVGMLVEKSTAFMDEKKVPTADLANYHALLQTTMGPLEVEFWPDVAPNHVRNFLDLCATGFYDGIGFHRVSPGFMAQCGDPNTKTNDRNSWGTGSGPRRLKAEFNAKKHVRGVLSAARSQDPNSASSQFFLMDAPNTGLDNQYSGFGKLVDGYDTLDKIVRAPGVAGPDGTIKPNELPRIQRAQIVKLVQPKAEKADKPDTK